MEVSPPKDQAPCDPQPRSPSSAPSRHNAASSAPTYPRCAPHGDTTPTAATAQVSAFSGQCPSTSPASAARWPRPLAPDEPCLAHKPPDTRIRNPALLVSPVMIATIPAATACRPWDQPRMPVPAPWKRRIFVRGHRLRGSWRERRIIRLQRYREVVFHECAVFLQGT